MLKSDNQFVYGEGLGANCFVPVCSIFTSKTIINVDWEGHEVSGDERKRQIL
jgi:hypothetical protein